LEQDFTLDLNDSRIFTVNTVENIYRKEYPFARISKPLRLPHDSVVRRSKVKVFNQNATFTVLKHGATIHVNGP